MYVQDEDQWSALYYAARNGHKPVVVFLVHHGASIGLKDKKVNPHVMWRKVMISRHF